MLTIRLDPDQEKELALLAKEKGASKSEFVRGLISQAITQQRSDPALIVNDILAFRKRIKGKINIRELIEAGRD